MPRWQDYKDGQMPRGALMRNEINAFRAMGWQKGWQPDVPDTHVPLDALTYIMNYNWLDGHAVQRRGGFELVTTNPVGLDQAQQAHVRSVTTAASLSAAPVYTQEVLYFNDDDGEMWYNTLGELLEQHFASTGSNLAYSSHSIGAHSPSASNYARTFNINSVVFEDKIYITALRYGGYSATSTDQTHNGAGGASKPIKYDVLNDTFSRPSPHALDGSATGFPTARCAIAEYDRVFCANIYSQGVYRYPSRIYWSDAGTAETFGANSYIEVGMDDGQEITALLPMGDSILIFKDHSTYILLGTNEDTFALRNLNPRFGTRSSSGAVEHKGMVYFFDGQEGLLRYDGANFVNVSEPINDYMLNDGNYNREIDYKVNVQAFDDRIFVSMGTGSGTDDIVDHTYIYDVRLNAWTQWDHGIPSELTTYTTDAANAAAGVLDTGFAYFSSPSDQLGLFRLEGNISEDDYTVGATTVSAVLRTGWLSPGDMGFRHRIRRFEMLTEAGSEGDADIVLYRDFNATDVWQSATFDPSGNLDAWHEMDSGYDIKEMFTWLQMQVTHNQGTDLTSNIQGYQITVSSRPFHRGVRPELNIAPVGGCS